MLSPNPAKNRYILAFAFFCILANIFLAVQAAQAWRFDAQLFQESAHGTFSCQQCHQDVLQREHPDPDLVNRQLHQDFDPEFCGMCHPGIRSELEEDRHAGFKIMDRDIFQKCYMCHDTHTVGAPEQVQPDPDPLAGLSEADADCMQCHHEPASFLDQEHQHQSVQNTQDFCMHCHSAEQGFEQLVQLDSQAYDHTPHAALDCLDCHQRANQFPHNEQQTTDCLQCHQRHEESLAHDAHLTVHCESCHLQDIKPQKPADRDQVSWKRLSSPGAVSNIHALDFDKDQDCTRCHAPGNQLGAAGLVLPPKSVACMPCHAGTFTASDTVSATGLLLFAGGLILVLGVYFTASLPGDPQTSTLKRPFVVLGRAWKTISSRQILAIARSLWRDVLLQDRLKKRSRTRWLIHALIFWPFVFRFLYGLVALLGSTYLGQVDLFWGMLDKNNPVTALLFDISGICILTGVILAWRRGLEAGRNKLENMPGQDRIALALIAAAVLTGFILEGMRIALTGTPAGSGFAFAGYILSLPFSIVSDLTMIYSYFWYLHGILWAAFLVYLPFSNMLHIILGPLALAMNAARQKH